MISRRTLLVGIGSRHGDDQIGWLVAESLRPVTAANVDVRQASTPSQLLDWLDGVDRLIVCDACQRYGGSCLENDDVKKNSSLHRWEWPTLEVSSLRSAGSHAFGLPQVLQLAERLNRLPPVVVVFGIEASRFDAFTDAQPQLLEQLTGIAELVLEELDRQHDRLTREPVRHA
ncbi:MAG: hydrogenase maturation protease [Rhodopirellula sp.]|nr:hydrogenase maturation protease [Rhodopirellula sp.]